MRVWLVVAVLVYSLVLAVGGALGGWSWCKWRTERGVAQQVLDLQEEVRQREGQIAEMAVAMSRAQGRVKVVYRDLREEARRHEREIPDVECFGPADVRLLNQAASGGATGAVPSGIAGGGVP